MDALIALIIFAGLTFLLYFPASYIREKFRIIAAQRRVKEDFISSEVFWYEKLDTCDIIAYLYTLVAILMVLWVYL